MNDKRVFTENNFNLVRLLAAFQVVFHHTSLHLNVKISPNIFFDAFNAIPGVPVFFFISGYLISKSYENNSLIKEYAQNRILRIYPALFFCVFLSFLSVYLLGYFSSVDVTVFEVLKWLFGQVSFYQFYNPEFMRSYGTGVINGSLWTITVELQFYILIPILFFLLKKLKVLGSNNILITLIIIFLIINRIYYFYLDDFKEHMFFKLIGVSFFPWFYMFLVGVIVQRNFMMFFWFLSGKFLYMLIGFSVYLWAINDIFNIASGNALSPLVFFPMLLVVFSGAYTGCGLSKSILKRNDISYGVYIYHMPVINALLYLGYKGDLVYMLYVLVITIFLAILSWKLIEYPSLKLKKHPLNPFSVKK